MKKGIFMINVDCNYYSWYVVKGNKRFGSYIEREGIQGLKRMYTRPIEVIINEFLKLQKFEWRVKSTNSMLGFSTRVTSGNLADDTLKAR